MSTHSNQSGEPGFLDYLTFMGPMSPLVGQDRQMTDKIYQNIDGVLESPGGKDVMEGLKEIPFVDKVVGMAHGGYKIGEGIHKTGVVDSAAQIFRGLFD